MCGLGVVWEWRVHNLIYGKIGYGGDARSSIVVRKGGIYYVCMGVHMLF